MARPIPGSGNVGSAQIGAAGVVWSNSNIGESGVGMPASGITVNGAFALTKYSWTGSDASVTIAVADTFYPLGLTTAAQGTQTNITDNNDGSLTNNSGGTLTVQGLITVTGGNANTNMMSAQTDESGSWAEIDTQRGMSNDWTAGGNLGMVVAYSLSLSNGKSVRPVVMNYDNTNAFTLANFEHIMWGV